VAADHASGAQDMVLDDHAAIFFRTVQRNQFFQVSSQLRAMLGQARVKHCVSESSVSAGDRRRRQLHAKGLAGY